MRDFRFARSAPAKVPIICSVHAPEGMPNFFWICGPHFLEMVAAYLARCMSSAEIFFPAAATWAGPDIRQSKAVTTMSRFIRFPSHVLKQWCRGAICRFFSGFFYLFSQIGD